MRKKTTDQFIEEARAKHGDRYDYSQVAYVGTHRDVQIICKTHGPFLQRPKVHLRGCGCSDCVGNKRKTTDQFIADAQARHGDRYDYSQVDYFSSKDVVQIICKIHGPFPQTPHEHLDGCGCPDCGGSKPKVTGTFIAKARVVHGDIYDYSLVEYSNSRTKVQIICKTHGIFPQEPNSHLNGNGCPDCAGVKLKDTSVFIKDAQRKHGDRYDYSQVIYVAARLYVQIICKTHGPFPQTPNGHLNGYGCPKCGDKQKANVQRRRHRLNAQLRFAKYADVFREMSENQEES